MPDGVLDNRVGCGTMGGGAIVGGAGGLTCGAVRGAGAAGTVGSLASGAMGLGGSDIAANSAGVALMNDDLSRVPFLIELARRIVDSKALALA
mgnify:CR=1 FL=1